MYATARVIVGQGQPTVALPSSAINYAPYGNSVFILEDMKGPDGKSYRGGAPAVRETGALAG